MPSSMENAGTILVTGARAPVALHLARLFHGAGKRVILADTPAHPISSASAACFRHRQLPPPRFSTDAYAKALAAVVHDEGVDVVVPTCEEIFYLGQVWRDRAMPAQLFAPDMDMLTRVHDKHAFIRLAQTFGLEVPETTLLQSTVDLDAVRPHSRGLVFKPVWSRFASNVLLRPHADALDAVIPTVVVPWIAQRFVEGDEISAYCVARAGHIKALALYRSLYRAGKGAGVCFEPVLDKAACDFVTAFVACANWTGQISFDLMRERGGRVLPLECNPRATSGLHFFGKAAAFCDAFLKDGPVVSPDASGVYGIPLAVWLYGLPAALKERDIGRFRRTLHGLTDILDWPGDSAPRKAQFRALAEIAGTALRHRISLQAASTRDIEWNGPLQSSI